MLSSFWSCASLRSGGGRNPAHRPFLCAWGSPPRPPHPRAQRGRGTAWPRHPPPITLQLPGWAERKCVGEGPACPCTWH